MKLVQFTNPMGNYGYFDLDEVLVMNWTRSSGYEHTHILFKNGQTIDAGEQPCDLAYPDGLPDAAS